MQGLFLTLTTEEGSAVVEISWQGEVTFRDVYSAKSEPKTSGKYLISGYSFSWIFLWDFFSVIQNGKHEKS